MKINIKDINKHINTIWRQNELAEFLGKCEESEVKPMQVFIDMKPNEGIVLKSVIIICSLQNLFYRFYIKIK